MPTFFINILFSIPAYLDNNNVLIYLIKNLSEKVLKNFGMILKEYKLQLSQNQYVHIYNPKFKICFYNNFKFRNSISDLFDNRANLTWAPRCEGVFLRRLLPSSLFLQPCLDSVLSTMALSSSSGVGFVVVGDGFCSVCCYCIGCFAA